MTKYKLGLGNPAGNRVQFKRPTEQLEDIRKAARDLWAVKDTHETTSGWYHRPYHPEELLKRESSPTRKNNPHPTKVFLATRMSHIPGHFDDNDYENRSRSKINVPEFKNMPHKDITSPSLIRYSNTNEYLKTIDPKEADHVDECFKKAGIDVSMSNLNYLPSSASASRHEKSFVNFEQSTNMWNNKESKSLYNLHDNTTGDSEYRANYMGKSSADEIDPMPLRKKDQTTGTLQSNETNPYLYNDYRVYREKYANGDHGCPNPDAKRYWPSRGEFSIHPDWHARLKHHRLPCNC